MRVEETEVYRAWINALKDRVGRARIQVRVDRLVHGNPGKYRNLTDGVSELKIDFGPDIASITRSEELAFYCCSQAVTNLHKRAISNRH